MNRNDKIEPYAKVIVRLLQSTMDSEDRLWSELLQYQIQVTEFFERIGVELIINKDDEYAYIQQMELDDEKSTIGLVRRMPLSYEVSIICVLLREMLDEFETGDFMTRNFHISHHELKERIELFFKEKTDRVKFLKNLDTHIRKIEDLGFLKVKKQQENLDERLYEVRRILKAKISIDDLESFKNKLKENVESL